MKLLIVGRTATGKDTLRESLEKFTNMTFVKSYATRPKRYPDEDTHIFVTKEQASEIMKTDTVIARTTIADNDYFATKSQIENADGYIIDPIGIYELINKMPTTDFLILYLMPNKDYKDIYIERELAKNVKTKTEIIKELDKRMTSEDKIFTEFDKNIDSLLENHKNIVAVKKLNFITNPKTKVTKVEQMFFAELVKDIIRVYE
jgi:hypothetical protein